MVVNKRRPRRPASEHFIFEISSFEHRYSVLVNPQGYEEPPYWEHSTIRIPTVCVFPAKLAGRDVLFDVAARRDFWTPYEWRKDPNWRPRCVGQLELPLAGGRFYSSIPQESMAAFLTAMTHGLFRFILLYGPPLTRGKSLCGSMSFERAVDLDEY
jgi:hypothetical protein